MKTTQSINFNVARVFFKSNESKTLSFPAF
jgi:hypothetical protein